MVRTVEIVETHCRCGNPFESIYSQFINRCRMCERIEDVYGVPAHFGPPNPPNAPAILNAVIGRL